ncbi:MAG: ABC transporter ATP-binding protein [Terriglobales bacterium]
MLAVECLDLTKDFRAGFWRSRPVRALDHLSLRIEPGEIFGLLGHNGAGKTTTLKLLLRLIFPTSGEARILGQPAGATASQIGYLPENPYFYDYLRCRELVEYFAELAGVPARQRRQRAAEALGRVGMAAAAETALRKCSKGMVQRVGLAQAIVHRPAVLFLDEPMSGLDPLGRRQVRELILELKAGGATVVFSTHILSDAEQLCDRVAILRQGRLAGQGALETLLAGEVDRVEVGFTQGGAARHRVVAKADLWQQLDQLRAAGATIAAITPLRRSLEEIFLAPGTAPAAAPPEGGEAPSRTAGRAVEAGR